MTTQRLKTREIEITPKWLTVAQVAAMLGYGLTKTQISGSPWARLG